MLRHSLATCTFVLATGTLAAADPAATQGPMMPQPTEQHLLLQKLVGDFEGTITMFQPGMPAMPSPATETITSVGKFWTTSRFECEFMGMPYVGSGYTGYDPEKKKYVGVWLDNMSATATPMEGDWDDSKKAIVFNWMAPDMTGQVVPHRSENVMGSDGYVATFFQGKGEMVKSMEIRMKRKSAERAEASAAK